MNALIEAKSLYEKSELNFEADLGLYLANGYVISSPERFIMFKPISKSIGDSAWNVTDPDCWYVHCAVGSGLWNLVKEMPYYLPFTAWRRSWKQKVSRVRFYSTDRIIQLTK